MNPAPSQVMPPSADEAGSGESLPGAGSTDWPDGHPAGRTWFALYGFCLASLSIPLYLAGVVMAIPRRLLMPDSTALLRLNEGLVWYSGLPLTAGCLLLALDLWRKVARSRAIRSIANIPDDKNRLTVALTAYNDELSIAASVADFLAHPRVARVIVVSNNSVDATEDRARAAGAIVHNEPRQGYGSCVHRALTEATRFTDTTITVLCEGDMTFRAADIDKLLAYLPHGDIVNGTRIVEQLQEKGNQLSLFMHYGNLYVGKLLEMKHLGMVTLTDVGTTYKLCRNRSLTRLLPHLDPGINMEFNPYMLDAALTHGLRIIECPVTFHPRLGVSKGGNVSNAVATRVGLRMIAGILTDWSLFRRASRGS